MPPEMFIDEDDKTNMFAVDVYAIGIILWQLWFQELPFEGKSVHKIMAHVTNGKRLSLKPSQGHHLAPPAQLGALIEQCWAQEWTARPPIDQVFEVFDGTVEPAIQALINGGLKEPTLI
jgi:hypothetical protein